MSKFFEFRERISAEAWPLNEAVFITCAIFVAQMTLALGMTLLQKSGRPLPSPGSQVVIQSLFFHGLTGILILYTWRQHRQHVLPGMSRPLAFVHLGKGLLYYLAALPLILAASIFSNYLMQLLNYDIEPQDVVVMLLQSDAPLAIELYAAALAVVVAPVVEETFFRGLLLPVALKHLPAVPAVLLVSLLFGSMHGNPASVLPLTVLGIFFSVSFLRTGSLYPAITAHALFNAATIALIVFVRALPSMWIN